MINIVITTTCLSSHPFCRPSGKLVQIEYALNAVQNGSPCVGIKAKDGIVLACENKASALEVDTQKIEKVCKHIVMVYAGMGPDYRLLVSKARKLAAEYEMSFGDPIPLTVLVQKVAGVMQEYTQSGGVRPFGVSLLIGGHDADKGPLLFQVDPSGAFFAWKSTALGKNSVTAKGFLEKRYSSELDVADAVHLSLVTLKETFETALTEDNVSVATVSAQGVIKLYNHEQLEDVIRGL